MRIQLLVLLVCFSSAATADPLCGVAPDGMFKSSFEASELPAPPYVPLPTLPSDSTPVTLSVTYPGDGITVGTSSIQIYGTFTGPANTGISVNDAAALQSGTNFLSRDVSLKPGVNTLTIKATSALGVTQSLTRAVTYSAGQAPDAELKSAFTGDYAPLSLRFSVALRAGIANPIIERVRVDYDSDSTFDTDTTDATARLSFRYQATGPYVATVELTLNDGNAMTPPVVVTATRRVLGEDLDVTRATFCKAYATHRANLTAQQYTAALQVFNAEVRPNYQSFIEGLGANGATVATGLGEIVDGTIGQDSAELVLARPISGQPGRFHRFPLQFNRDSDGVWRISAL